MKNKYAPLFLARMKKTEVLNLLYNSFYKAEFDTEVNSIFSSATARKGRTLDKVRDDTELGKLGEIFLRERFPTFVEMNPLNLMFANEDFLSKGTHENLIRYHDLIDTISREVIEVKTTHSYGGKSLKQIVSTPEFKSSNFSDFVILCKIFNGYFSVAEIYEPSTKETFFPPYIYDHVHSNNAIIILPPEIINSDKIEYVRLINEVTCEEKIVAMDKLQKMVLQDTERNYIWKTQ